MHPFLADTRISSLLGNAVKYNYDGRNIEINISANSYRISNTSLLDPIPEGKLFKRFNISVNNRETSNGLGLAIIKKLQTHIFQVNYNAENGVTVLKIKMHEIKEPWK